MVIHDKKKKLVLSIINFVIELLYAPVRLFSRKIDFSSFVPRKILLIRLDHIGDVVMTSPAFTLLKDKFPESEIILLTSSAGKQLYSNHPAVDKLVQFNWPWSYQKSDNRFTFKKIKQIADIVILLRKEKIDLCVDFRGDIRFVILFGVLTGARCRISNSRSGNSSLLHNITPYHNLKHEVDRSLEVLECIVKPEAKIYPRLKIHDEELNAAKRFVASVTGSSVPGQIALIAPYSSQHIKSWPDDHFRQVMKHLVARGFTVLVLGTDEDRVEADALTAGFEENVYSITGRTKIREAAALICMSDVIIGVDTGVLHIASCFNTLIVAIFGATRSLEYAPYSKYATVVDSGTCVCNQFLHMSCDHPVNTFSKCLYQLSPTTVIGAIEESLSNVAAPKGSATSLSAD